MQLKEFHVGEYVEKIKKGKVNKLVTITEKPSAKQIDDFNKLCSLVYQNFMKQFDEKKFDDKLLERNNKAIIGYQNEKSFFYDEINKYLRENNLENEWYPDWFNSLTEAIFHENWGLSGIARWMTIPNSQSAKIIGNRIYYASPKNGKLELQKQTITNERVSQLIRALLLKDPHIRMDEGFANVYMLDGTRITIFDSKIVKEPTIIFRKYVVDRMTLEEQAFRRTIPKESIPMFKAMIAVGFNVCFIGPVKCGKTTFMATWQSYEDDDLEGVQVETDPEVPQHKLKPNAPIIQFVADGEKLKNIIKLVKRCDGDYVIMAEARDTPALKILIDVTKIGTRRAKSTFHTADPIDFCYDAASDIVSEFGGDIWATCIKVARCYNYLIEMVQLKDKSQKRVKGVYEIRFDPEKLEITVHQIMKYDFLQDSWTYNFTVGEDKEEIALQENYEAFQMFKDELQRLSSEKPMDNSRKDFVPAFNHLLIRR